MPINSLSPEIVLLYIIEVLICKTLISRPTYPCIVPRDNAGTLKSMVSIITVVHTMLLYTFLDLRSSW